MFNDYALAGLESTYKSFNPGAIDIASSGLNKHINEFKALKVI
ncbi:hypothetical protein [uncultured Chryseobacterium sp.]|nr:hypothetical protein [uncultured Chryseobacterium sp.]